MIEQRFFSRLQYWVRHNLAAWGEIRQLQGWIRKARLAQGLKGVDLAKRLDVSPARVSMMESDEERGAVTLKMMQRTAQALDCEFVYLLIPKKALVDRAAAKQKKSRIRIQTQADTE